MVRVPDYHDIPGTTVFDAEQSRRGYHLNMFCMSLMRPENRTEFKNDEDAYLRKFPMSAGQRGAVRAREWNAMIGLGGNIYFLSKLFFTDEKSFQQVAAEMTGMSQADYAAMMLAGGRSVDGARSKSDIQTGGRR